jgi:hypothetical protein
VINAALTPNGYYLKMQTGGQKQERSTTGKKTGIWMALSAAFGLHLILLFLPITQQTKLVNTTRAQSELQLTTLNPQTEVLVAEPPPPPTKSPDIPEPAQSIVEPPIEIVQPVLTPEPRVSQQEHIQETQSELEKNRSLDSGHRGMWLEVAHRNIEPPDDSVNPRTEFSS